MLTYTCKINEQRNGLMNLKINEAIDLLENSLNLKFSEEQFEILTSGFKNPILVNACAGSGKTTILILAVLVAIMTGKTSADEIMGITFSKMAQNDMSQRYQQYINKLPKGTITGSKQPNFSTFHALFYHLLMLNPEYITVQVLSSWKSMYYDLKSAIIHGNSQISEYELLDQIFQLKDYLNNQDLSHDGYHIDGTDFMTKVREIEKNLRIEHSVDFYKDYVNVVARYEELKRTRGFVDFNDMKSLLLDSMQDEQMLALYRQAMEKYSLVFLDEFQDIDPQQWKIINLLLGKKALARLTAIGDDDQNIYRFRGSSPKYLLQYPKYVPSSQIYHLSTNYRTGGRILASAIPLIKENKNRLEKKLDAYNGNVGKIFTHYEKESVLDVQNNSFVESFISDINNTDLSNNEIAILVRYNQSRTFIADYLSEKGIFVNIQNKNFILQNDKIYCIYMDLMRSLWQDKFSPFYQHANNIGFKRYQTFIGTLKKKQGYTRLSKLSVLIGMLKEYLLNDPTGEISAMNVQVISAYEETQKLKERYNRKCSSANAVKTLQTMLKIVANLTSSYFDFMTERQYIAKSKKEAIYDYLLQLVSLHPDVDAFFKNEQAKKKKLEGVVQQGTKNSSVSLLSLHQSKGLEFKHVYLFDLNNKDLPEITERMYRWFIPGTSFPQFIKRLSFLTQNKVFTKIFEAGCESLRFKSYQKVRATRKTLQQLVDEVYMTGENWEELKELYVDIMQFVNFVEEERRLLYVGVTRSQEVLFLDFPKNPNPLLYELDLRNAKEINKGAFTHESKKTNTYLPTSETSI